MRKRVLPVTSAALAVTALICVSNYLNPPRLPRRLSLAEQLARQPITFEQNDGQTDRQVRFFSRGPNYTLFLTKTDAVLEVGAKTSTSVVKLKLVGANTDCQVIGERPSVAESHYYIGSDPAKWRTHVPQVGRVRYHEIYKGIDLVFYGNGRRLEYDFIVGPGADPGQIRLAAEGADLRLAENGDALLQTRSGDLRVCKPRIYQESDGRKTRVDGDFAINTAERELQFNLAYYDNSKPLVIDPLFDFTAGFGGNSDDFGLAIARDRTGNIYITGHTFSTDFPVTEDVDQATRKTGFDVFVTSMLGDGTAMLYSTYFGGSDSEEGRGVAVDRNRIAYVTGYTRSTDLPRLEADAFQSGNAGVQDAFVAGFYPDGTLSFSTYLGGNGNDTGIGIAVNSAGDIYVLGSTDSTNFPTKNPLQPNPGGQNDLFLTQILSDYTGFGFSTYYGGSKSEAAVAVTSQPAGGLALDAQGNIYFTSFTTSLDLVTMNAYQPASPGSQVFSPGQAFIVKVKPDGSGLLYASYFGGTDTLGSTYGYAIAVNDSGQAAITGSTRSTQLPLRNPVQNTFGGTSQFLYGDAYFALFDTTQSGDASLVRSSYLGGNGDDYGSGITLDPAANIVVVGTTNSVNFPFAGQATGGTVFRLGSDWQRANTGLVPANPQDHSAGIIMQTVVDPNDATGNTIYVATRNGGVWKTTNFLNPAGPTWTEMNTGLTEFTLESIGINPANSNELFVGTEFGSAFRSTDGGAHWTSVSTGLGFSTASNIDALLFTPGAVYCGSQIGGVFKTTNDGGQWNPMNNGLGSKAVSSLAVDPTNPNALYAGTANGVYQSSDGGANWAPANGNLPDFYTAGGIFARKLTFAPGTSKLLVSVAPSFSGDPGGIFETTDGGQTYSQLVQFGSRVAGQTFVGFSASDIAIDPANPDIIYAGTDGFSGRGVVRSTDGGKTWQNIGLNGIPISSVIPLPGGAVFAGTQGGDDGFRTIIPVSGPANTRILGGTGEDAFRGVGPLHDVADPNTPQSGPSFFAGGSISQDIPFTSGALNPPGFPTDAVDPNNPGPEVLETREFDKVVVVADDTTSSPTATPQADLKTTKICTPEIFASGATITCTIIVSNNGPDTATKVDMIDTCSLNDPAKGQVTTSQDNDVTVTKNPAGQKKLIRFDLPDLAKGQRRTLTITYKGVLQGFSNLAIGSTATFDPDLTDNEDKFKTKIGTSVPAPKIDNVNPPKSKPGGTTNINGTGLNGGSSPKAMKVAGATSAQVTTDTVVKFNGVTANILSISDTQITAEVPEGATTGPLTVTTAGGTATAPDDFVVLPAIQQLLNISTRLRVLTGENVLIGGFIVTGNDDKKVLLRGLGPSLTGQGVPDALADPILELHQGSAVVATNDNWKDTQQAEIAATTIPPTSDLESAMVQTLTAHATAYTAIVSGNGGGVGIGLVEAYDLTQASADSQLANISTRGFVDTGDNVLIGGVIVGGGAAGRTTNVLVRAIGPSLGAAGVQSALDDPTLELRDGNGGLIAQNDDWRTDQEQAINDTTIPPSDDRESAIVQVLGAGNYTAIVRGKNGGTGVALVELYNLGGSAGAR